MQRQGLLVELRLLDRSDGLLDAEADQHFGRDGLAAHGAGLNLLLCPLTQPSLSRGEGRVDVRAVVEHRRPAVPVAVKGQLHAGAQQLRQA